MPAAISARMPTRGQRPEPPARQRIGDEQREGKASEPEAAARRDAGKRVALGREEGRGAADLDRKHGQDGEAGERAAQIAGVRSSATMMPPARTTRAATLRPAGSAAKIALPSPATMRLARNSAKG